MKLFNNDIDEYLKKRYKYLAENLGLSCEKTNTWRIKEIKQTIITYKQKNVYKQWKVIIAYQMDQLWIAFV